MKDGNKPLPHFINCNPFGNEGRITREVLGGKRNRVRIRENRTTLASASSHMYNSVTPLHCSVKLFRTLRYQPMNYGTCAVGEAETCSFFYFASHMLQSIYSLSTGLTLMLEKKSIPNTP